MTNLKAGPGLTEEPVQGPHSVPILGEFWWSSNRRSVDKVRLSAERSLFWNFGAPNWLVWRGLMWARIRLSSTYIYIYIIYAVESKKLVQDFPFYKLKTGPIFPFFLFFIIKHLILPAERRGFLKNKQKQLKKTHFYKLKTGPIMSRNILGPVFNLYLDQFLTYNICYFFVFFLFFFGGGGGWNPYVYSGFSKKCKI